MHNDELDEKNLTDFIRNTTVRVEMTVEQASTIYASLMCCADRFRKIGLTRKADSLETLATALMGQTVTSALDE